MDDAKVTSKGQVTIPKGIRDRLGISKGDYLRFTVEDDGTVRMEPLDAEGRPRPLAGWLNDRVAVEGPVDLERLGRAMEASVAAHVLAGLE